MDPFTDVEVRVLGCLLEKEKATPQNYPLTLNALRLACNQSTNRDPVVDYGEAEIDGALTHLRELGLTRNVYSTSNRATKYRHVLGEAWGLSTAEEAVLAVLLLRGAQTVGEVRGRLDRLADLGSLAEVEAVLHALADRPDPLVRLLPRRPGQKDPRWIHLLAGAAGPTGEPDPAPRPAPASAPAPAPAPDRLAALEAEVAALRAEVVELRADLAAVRDLWS